MRSYNQQPPLGASMSGPTYEPQVTPYDRDDDTVAVNQSRSRRQGYDAEPYDNNDYASRRGESSGRGRDDGDVWNRRDLVPEYGMSREERDRKQPWDNYRSRRRYHEEATAGYGELADAYADRGQYRQPWDDYLRRDTRGR